jgi:hypothetical protein
VALKSTILLGTIVSQATGGPFLAQPLATIKKAIKRIILALISSPVIQYTLMKV